MTTTVSPAIIEQLSTEPGPILVWVDAAGSPRKYRGQMVWPKGRSESGRCAYAFTSRPAVFVSVAYFGGNKPDPFEYPLETVLDAAKELGYDWLLLVDEHWCVVDKWRVQ